MTLYAVQIGQYLLPIEATSAARAAELAKFYVPNMGEPVIVA